jgi:hypothetical protein
MHAARVNEPLGTYTCTDLTAANYEEAIPQNGQVWQRKTMVDYGSAGARHLHQLGELATRNTGLLRIHSCEIAKAIGAAELETRDNLTKLLTKHAEEWHEFVSAQGKESFLYNWTKGGRYGRSE